MPAVQVLISLTVSLFALKFLLTYFDRFALDRPNERSLHERPVPRTGGFAVLAGAATAFAFGAAPLWLPAVLAVALAGISLLDDLSHMPTALRLTAHLAASSVVVWYLLSPLNPVLYVVLVLAVTWTTNLYNFMDGSDGLAGGMSFIGFGIYAVATSLSGDSALAALSIALSAAAAGFLVYNFHPARIFLGDIGSIPLGFLAGVLGLAGWVRDVWPLWFPLLVFAPFMCDATLTLLRRAFRGERVWRAHRDHYYQRLVRMGYGHRATAWIEYTAMLGCGLLALFARNAEPLMQAVTLGMAVIGLSAVAVWVDVRWTRFVTGESRVV